MSFRLVIWYLCCLAFGFAVGSASVGDWQGVAVCVLLVAWMLTGFALHRKGAQP